MHVSGQLVVIAACCYIGEVIFCCNVEYTASDIWAITDVFTSTDVCITLTLELSTISCWLDGADVCTDYKSLYHTKCLRHSSGIIYDTEVMKDAGVITVCFQESSSTTGVWLKLHWCRLWSKILFSTLCALVLVTLWSTHHFLSFGQEPQLCTNTEHKFTTGHTTDEPPLPPTPFLFSSINQKLDVW